MLIFLFLNI